MKITRMLQAINHQQPDRVPRGELLIDREVISSLMPNQEGAEFEQKKAALSRLRMDFVAISPKPLNFAAEEGTKAKDPFGRKLINKGSYWQIIEPAIKSIDRICQYQFPEPGYFDFTEVGEWVNGSDLFVFGLLDGVFQELGSLLNFNDFLLATVKNQREIELLANAYGDLLYQLAAKAFAAGAHGLIIGDDMASSQGPLIAPKTMEKLFYPVYKRILALLSRFQQPIMLHCDGNIEFLLPHLKEMGFAGIHSLEPAAGMDLATVKKQYGQQLCLMGNIDPALLEQNDLSRIEKTVRNAIAIGSPGGGYILSTASGSLTKEMNLNGILAMYHC
ncbi:MAG: uroporphyrinogen decarboxylase family protein [Bacillota bacterium]